MILHLKLDELVRQQNPDNDGLFAIWRAYESKSAQGSEDAGSTFRQVVAELAGEEAASWVEQFVTSVQPDFDLLMQDPNN